MSFRSFSMVAVVAAAASVGACAPGATKALTDSEPRAGTSTVRVANNNWSDVTIYIVRGGMRARLGSVGSMTEETFRIPAGMMGGAGDVTLVARPLASRTAYRTDRLMVAPGQRIDLRLENNLQLSNYAIW